MALFVGSTVINSADIERGIAFWTAGKASFFLGVTRPLRTS